MHRRVLLVRDPGLLVDERQPPVRLSVAGVMIEPRHRAIIDVEGETLVRQPAERESDRGLDRAAMADRDDVPARLRARDAVDRRCYATIEVHETLAAGRGLVDIGEPAGADRTRRDEGRAVHALPSPEILFGEGRLPRHIGGPRKAGIPDRFRGLMRALQIARDPHRAARQDLRDRLEHFGIAGVAGDVGLAVDVAAVVAHRRVAHPPPSRDDDFGLSGLDIRNTLPYCLLPSYVSARNVSSDSC